MRVLVNVCVSVCYESENVGVRESANVSVYECGNVSVPESLKM